jgi:ribosomal protein L37AE/L43A
MRYVCLECGEGVDERRVALGYKHCLECGEARARDIKHCIVPMNKVAYMLVTDMETLKQLNPKRTT